MPKARWLVVPALCLPAIAFGCGDDEGSIATSTAETLPECDGIAVASEVMKGHSHGICVPSGVLSSPPAPGVTLTSTVASGHAHDVALSAAQLAALGRGDTVTVSSTMVEDHAHAFMFRGR